MKKHSTFPVHTGPHRGRCWAKAALLALLASSSVGHAQSIVAPIDTSPESSRASTSNPAGGSASSGPLWGSTAVAPSSPLQWGPFNVRPHVIYRILYSDGLQATPGHPTSTTINSFSPGLLAELGTHWTFDYTPTWNEYTSHDFRDTLDHVAKLAWGTAYEEWVLHASQLYNRSTSPQIQTGQQTRETDHLTNLDVSYQFAGDLIAQTVVTRSLRFVEGFNDTREWSLLEMLHLRESPQLDSALGIEYGYETTTHSPDMSFVQYLARVAWKMSEQLSLEIQGGWENRQVKQAGASDLNSPVLKTSLHYQPVETTGLSLTHSHGTTASFFANQVVETSVYEITLDQRLLQHFRLNLGAEYQEAKYRSTLPLLPFNRRDKNYSFTAGLRTAVLRRVDVTLQYRKSHNSSNVAGYGFSSDQIGLEIGYRY